jgi:hypothetical protein
VVPVQVRLVVYSQKRLMLTGMGPESGSLGMTDTAYAYRYSGLRLLRHTKDRWLLLPRGWVRGNHQSVIMLPDTPDTIRAT